MSFISFFILRFGFVFGAVRRGFVTGCCMATSIGDMHGMRCNVRKCVQEESYKCDLRRPHDGLSHHAQGLDERPAVGGGVGVRQQPVHRARHLLFVLGGRVTGGADGSIRTVLPRRGVGLSYTGETCMDHTRAAEPYENKVEKKLRKKYGY